MKEVGIVAIDNHLLYAFAKAEKTPSTMFHLKLEHIMGAIALAESPHYK
ncbi:hypothetical protein ACFO3O_04055 [Dokdonia ponticola]|uniref:RadC-like JAB domain-containing protein n=1 Tax=Dokdonia ponticola TaxID=2041041 RepID=A0ABV9HUU4_9FLAO